MLQQNGAGRPSVSEADVSAIQETFTRSPSKSVCRASLQLGIPKSTVHKVLHKRLKLTAYILQIVQEQPQNARCFFTG